MTPIAVECPHCGYHWDSESKSGKVYCSKCKKGGSLKKWSRIRAKGAEASPPAPEGVPDHPGRQPPYTPSPPAPSNPTPLSVSEWKASGGKAPPGGPPEGAPGEEGKPVGILDSLRQRFEGKPVQPSPSGDYSYSPGREFLEGAGAALGALADAPGKFDFNDRQKKELDRAFEKIGPLVVNDPYLAIAMICGAAWVPGLIVHWDTIIANGAKAKEWLASKLPKPIPKAAAQASA